MPTHLFEPHDFLRVVIIASPVVLVAVIAVVLCIIRESLPQRVRMAIVGALLLQVANHLVIPLITLNLHRWVEDGSFRDPYLWINMAKATVHAIVLALLLYAAFAGRNKAVR